MSKKIKLILIILSVVMMTAAVASFSACTQVKAAAKQVVDESGGAVGAPAVDDNGNELYPGETYDLPEGIAYIDCASTSDGGGSGVTLTLEATVYPATATTKTVDWSIAWETPDSGFAAGKTVTDYVTVIPTADGSTTANVTCYAPFEGNIIVTVTTRSGGFTDTCIVSFIGLPSAISASAPGITPDANGVYHLTPETDNIVTVALDNAYHSVGVGYSGVTYTLTAVGNLIVNYKGWSDGSRYSVALSHTLAPSEFEWHEQFFPADRLSYTMPNITVNPKDIGSYVFMNRVFFSSQGLYDDWGSANFYEYEAGAYYLLTISQPDFGLSCEFKFLIDVPASGVSSAPETITF